MAGRQSRKEKILFYINKPAIDYLSLTTYGTPLFEFWYNRFTIEGDWIKDENYTKFENYTGVKVDRDNMGTVFIGEGVQRNKNHYLMYVSSHLSEVLFSDIVRMRRELRQAEREGEFSINCTRLDIQCTIKSPPGWSQWDLEERLHTTGHLVHSSASMSKNREFRTVYVGAGGSDRLLRIYQKMDDNDELFLRFEIQYRNNKTGGYAYQAWSTIRQQGEVGKAGILHNELITLGDSHLTDVFGPAIMSVSDDPIKLKREYSRSMTTRNWFTGQVIPALSRYVDENPFDAELVDMFARVLFPPMDKEG